MESLIIDCRTGEKTRHELAPEEIAARETATAIEYSLQQERQEAIERLRGTEMGRDILTLLGIGK